MQQEIHRKPSENVSKERRKHISNIFPNVFEHVRNRNAFERLRAARPHFRNTVNKQSDQDTDGGGLAASIVAGTTHRKNSGKRRSRINRGWRFRPPNKRFPSRRFYCVTKRRTISQWVAGCHLGPFCVSPSSSATSGWIPYSWIP